MNQGVEEQVELFFRKEYARVVAILSSKYGLEHLERIEDAVQEAMYKAMKVWPFHEIPDNPTAWILRVARNQLLDQFKSAASRNVSFDPETYREEISSSSETTPTGNELEIRDQQLQMIFACCHPGLSAGDQLLLSLKLLCGFGNKEMARALLKSHDAIEKSYTRAKRKFRDVVGGLEVPRGTDLEERLDAVIKVIYLLFNEGYKVSAGEELVNMGICVDAIKMAELLTEYPQFNTGKLNAVLALMFFQVSRLEARIGQDGNLLTLEYQDRSLWNQGFISRGLIYFGRSSQGGEISVYHLQAAIASYHCVAVDYASTPWEEILSLYDTLIAHFDSPIYRMNRLVAVEKVHGPTVALKELPALLEEKNLRNNHILHVMAGDLYKHTGKVDAASKAYEKAVGLTGNEVEQVFIRNKMDHLVTT